MAQLPMALTGVPTHELEMLLRYVHRREIEIPITPVGLAREAPQENHHSMNFRNIELSR